MWAWKWNPSQHLDYSLVSQKTQLSHTQTPDHRHWMTVNMRCHKLLSLLSYCYAAIDNENIILKDNRSEVDTCAFKDIQVDFPCHIVLLLKLPANSGTHQATTLRTTDAWFSPWGSLTSNCGKIFHSAALQCSLWAWSCVFPLGSTLF